MVQMNAMSAQAATPAAQVVKIGCQTCGSLKEQAAALGNRCGTAP